MMCLQGTIFIFSYGRFIIMRNRLSVWCARRNVAGLVFYPKPVYTTSTGILTQRTEFVFITLDALILSRGRNIRDKQWIAENAETFLRDGIFTFGLMKIRKN